MLTIASENLKNIRQSMNVFVHLQQLQNIPLTITTNNARISEPAGLVETSWDLKQFTDLADEGFPLDGSRILLESGLPQSASAGKYGVRSKTGEAMTVTVSASSIIAALTIRVFGEGTISANGGTYDVNEFMVIPVNSTSITMTCTPETDCRISIEDITPGIVLDFNNDNLISVNLDLESDLSITDASWTVSSIDIQAYYPYDISEAVSNMGDGVPVTYYAGYSGDYSAKRYFYLSEEVTQKDNVIHILAEDASSRLENWVQAESLWRVTRKECRRSIYNKLVNYITNSKIKVLSKEAQPPLVGTDTTVYTVMIQEGTFREHIQFIMDITNKNGFYPRFVDAGIPTLRWSTPTYKWSIYKKDIGDFEKEVDRNVNKIYGSDNEKPLVSRLAVQSNQTTIETKTVKSGEVYKFEWEDDYYNVQPNFGEIVSRSLRSLTVRSTKTTYTETREVQSGWTTVSTKLYKIGSALQVSLKGNNLRNYKETKSGNYIVATWEEPKYVKKSTTYDQMIIKGYKVVPVSSVSDNIVDISRYGITKEYTPKWYGMLYANYNNSYYRIPYYEDFFNKSNVKGSFTWKGNPKIQPRDVFRLYELDDTTYTTCTIESIETTHEGGGMISKITYREGIY